MPRGGAHFALEELAEVLNHYDIGAIKHEKDNRLRKRKISLKTQAKGKR